jgi:hypothetical protein
VFVVLHKGTENTNAPEIREKEGKNQRNSFVITWIDETGSLSLQREEVH